MHFLIVLVVSHLFLKKSATCPATSPAITNAR